MKYWNLYWVESDLEEDCFIVARNSRSAKSIESNMLCTDITKFRSEKLARIPRSVELKHNPVKHIESDQNDSSWPWYAKDSLLIDLGAEFRDIDNVKEMRLNDVVYAWDSDYPKKIRSIGSTALTEIRSNTELNDIYKYDEHDCGPEHRVIYEMLGLCLAKIHRIEHYISHSFLLGISSKQKNKYRTWNEFIFGWKKKTLGNLLIAIDESYEINPLVRSSFSGFLEMRNKLVHGITTSERFDINTEWGRKELIAFLASFDILSITVNRAFRSAYYASIYYAIEHCSTPELLPKSVLTEDSINEIAIFFEYFKAKH